MKNLLMIFMTLSLSFLHGGIRVVPVERSEEAGRVVTRIIFPRPYENKRKNPVNIQLRVEGFSLGTMTQNKRAKEIYNNPEGQSIHVLIDNEPYLAYFQSVEYGENKETADMILSFGLPFNLTQGQHAIRCFPAFSYGESFKGTGAFDAEIFYFQDKKKTGALNIDLKTPYLTYNEPQGRFPVHKSNPILLDFYLSNCDLSPDGYRVKLSIDKEVIGLLTQWIPFYLYGLEKGTHLIKLELIDSEGKIVPSFFNVAEREIIIE